MKENIDNNFWRIFAPLKPELPMLEIASSKNITRSIAFLLLLLAACSDDDSGPSYSELLAGTDKKTWRVYSSTLYGVEMLDECFRDDDWIFERNGNVTWRNTTTLCTNQPETQKSPWKISDDGESCVSSAEPIGFCH